jgi:hypothetical protein
MQVKTGKMLARRENIKAGIKVLNLAGCGEMPIKVFQDP